MRRLVIGLLLLSCGNAEENEARLLLDRYDTVDVDDLTERRRRIDGLRALKLSSERVRAAQTACSEMHAALVAAEEASATARRLLDAIERGDDSGPEQRQEVQAALHASADGVENARERRPECERRITELRTRYRSRRGD